MPYTQNLATNGVGRAILAGKFTTVNDAAPTSVVGEGFTVARTAEGRFTVTIVAADIPIHIVSVLVGLHREVLPSGTTSDVGQLVQCYIDQDSLTASLFEIRVELTNDLGIAEPLVALDDQPGAEIHFIAVVQYAGSTSD